MRRARMPGIELGCSEMDRKTSVISAWELSRIASRHVWLRRSFHFLAGRMSPFALRRLPGNTRWTGFFLLGFA